MEEFVELGVYARMLIVILMLKTRTFRSLPHTKEVSQVFNGIRQDLVSAWDSQVASGSYFDWLVGWLLEHFLFQFWSFWSDDAWASDQHLKLDERPPLLAS